MKITVEPHDPSEAIDLDPVQPQMLVMVHDDAGNPLVGIYFDPEYGAHGLFSLGYWKDNADGEWVPLAGLQFRREAVIDMRGE